MQLILPFNFFSFIKSRNLAYRHQALLLILQNQAPKSWNMSRVMAVYATLVWLPCADALWYSLLLTDQKLFVFLPGHLGILARGKVV